MIFSIAKTAEEFFEKQIKEIETELKPVSMLTFHVRFFALKKARRKGSYQHTKSYFAGWIFEKFVFVTEKSRKTSVFSV